MKKTYQIIQMQNRTAIKCLICNMTSHNPNDVKNKFCGHCNIFHEDNQILSERVFYQYEILGKKVIFSTIKEMVSFMESDIENLEKNEKLKIEITPILMSIAEYLKLKEFKGF